jgi:hypothetical protein
MNDPEEIRLKLWSVPQSEFYHEILLNVEKAFFDNDEELKRKTTITDSLIDWLIVQIVSMLAFLFFVFLLKAIGVF